MPQTVMSASPLKADMCAANRHVCYGPITDIVKKKDRLAQKRHHRERSGNFGQKEGHASCGNNA